VTVDRKRCESHGFCADAAPAVFSLDDESDDLVVADGPVEPDLEADVHAAVRVCPVAALIGSDLAWRQTSSSWEPRWPGCRRWGHSGSRGC
jgi:ferredoxin